MNLYMEISSLGVTFVACATSIFGMNLFSGLENHPYAFYVSIILIMVTGEDLQSVVILS